MFDGKWRATVDQGLEPIGAGLRRTGVSADVVTIVGVLMAVGCAFALATGRFRLGLLMLLLTGIPDALDGAVAKAAGTSSKRGAFFDSVSDRLTDALLFGGLAWHFAGKSGRLTMLPVALMALAMLVSYQRAKAESLGFDARGGLMERAERFIILAVGLLFSEFLVPVLWLMLVLTAFTAAQRFWKVWRQADRPVARPAVVVNRTRRRSTSRTPTVAERWRQQRETRRDAS